jgi:hypothetical protein
MNQYSGKFHNQYSGRFHNIFSNVHPIIVTDGEIVYGKTGHVYRGSFTMNKTHENKNTLFLKGSQKEDKGVIEFSNGDVFKASFMNDKVLFGHGEYRAKQPGNVYIGVFKGIISLDDPDVKNTVNVIAGTITYKNGDTYQGSFKMAPSITDSPLFLRDDPHGFMEFAETKEGQKEPEEGLFENDLFIGDVKQSSARSSPSDRGSSSSATASASSTTATASASASASANKEKSQGKSKKSKKKKNKRKGKRGGTRRRRK